MADDVRPDEDQAPPEGHAPAAPPVADAPPPAKATATPRLIRLEVQSDGTPAGTRLVDAETGEELRFDAFAVAEVHGGPPGMPGRARVQMVFDGAPVVSASNVTHPYTLLGVVLGRGGPPPVAAAIGHPAAPQAAPPAAEAGAWPAAGGGGGLATRGPVRVSDQAAMAHNTKLNQLGR